jgi:hypothetical protein
MGGTHEELKDLVDVARVEMQTQALPVSPRPIWISAVLELASAHAARARAGSVGAGAGSGLNTRGCSEPQAGLNVS